MLVAQHTLCNFISDHIHQASSSVLDLHFLLFSRLPSEAPPDLLIEAAAYYSLLHRARLFRGSCH